MKRIVLCFGICFTSSALAQAQAVDDYSYISHGEGAMFGLGFQLSSSPLFLLSWKGADQNAYGRSWRVEPMIGFSYYAQESAYDNSSNTTAALTLGLGYYLRWKVRHPFDNIYFTIGPRVLVTGTRMSYEYT